MNMAESGPVLDDMARLQTYDPRSMMRLVDELPEQCETALGIGRNLKTIVPEEPIDMVSVFGTGESALAVEMAEAVILEASTTPVVCRTKGRLPKALGENSLAVFVDHLGKDANTMANYREAIERGVSAVIVTSGGPLLEAANQNETPVVKILSGQPTRTALGYLFIPILTICEKYGIAPNIGEAASFAIKHMKNSREEFRYTYPTARNMAKQIATLFAGKMPVVFGAGDYREIVAKRWRQQINMNAKALALDCEFPGAASQDLSAWEHGTEAVSDCAFVYFKERNEDSDVASLMDISKELLQNYERVDVVMKGTSVIEKMMHGIYMGDYLSCYLGLLYERNPSAGENAKYLAARLAGEPIE